LINISSEIDGLTLSAKVGLAASVPQWCRIILICFITLVFFTGLPANVLIILVHFKTKKKTVIEWFVAFLAISDLLSLTVCLPIYVMIMKQWWPKFGSSVGCKFHYFIIYLNYLTSVTIIACIAVDRLWKTKTVKQLLSPKSAIYSCLLAFGYAGVFGIIATFSTGNNHIGECMLQFSKKNVLMICVIVTILTTTLCCAIIVYCYIRIAMIVRSRSRINPVQNVINQDGRTARTTLFLNGRYELALKTTKLMFIVTLVFIISTIIPMIATVGLVYTDYRNNSSGKIVMFFLTRLYLVNNCANPYFYLWLSKSIRAKVFAIFKSF
jgi:hypothetical protein